MAKILVIEDSSNFRLVVKKMLLHYGHQVADVGDGYEGINYLKENIVDLVITDIFLPEKDGIEFLNELRDLKPHPKVLAMTGMDVSYGADYLEIAKKAGADEVIGKPFNMQDLEAVVNRLLA